MADREIDHAFVQAAALQDARHGLGLPKEEDRRNVWEKRFDDLLHGLFSTDHFRTEVACHAAARRDSLLRLPAEPDAENGQSVTRFRAVDLAAGDGAQLAHVDGA